MDRILGGDPFVVERRHGYGKNQIDRELALVALASEELGCNQDPSAILSLKPPAVAHLPRCQSMPSTKKERARGLSAGYEYAH